MLLGVGGVGKTTLVYRLLGLSQRPAATLRPGIYRLYLEVGRVDVLDIPGQHAAEVAQAASRLMTLYFDRVLLVYDVTRTETLYALAEILDALCLFSRCATAREVIVVGNKRDLAEELGYMVENHLLPHRTYYVSALKDPPELLMELLLRRGGPQ